MIPPKTVLEQEYERISRADLSGKSQQEIQEFKRVKKNYTRVLSSIQYKLEAQQMSYGALRGEKHKSKRLGRYMAQEGMHKPGSGFEAHAIISGLDQRAASLRVEMALKKIRIDDTDNGCWLPKSHKDAVGTQYPKAIPHRRIHTMRYYDWLANIAIPRAAMLTDTQFRAKLKSARAKLQSGIVAGLVLKAEGQK